MSGERISQATAERAPEGSQCHRHQDRDAQITCPHCGKHCCVFCYHSVLSCCESCLRQNPAAAAAPIPFEQLQRPLLWRLGATLLSALRPTATAPAFAQPALGPAVRFLLLTAVPLSLLAGVIPHTRTLLFAEMAVSVLDAPDGFALTIDVVRAALCQLVLDAVHLTALWLPFVSLLRAYAGPERAVFGRRALLYRAWLVPAATLLTGLVLWTQRAPATGQEPEATVLLLLSLPQLLPVLLLLSMGYTARLACGLGIGWSILIVTVSVTVAAFASDAATMLVNAALPPLSF